MHTAARWVWLVGFATLACSQGSTSSGEESVRSTTAALTTAELSTLGFESAGQWQVVSGAATLAQSTVHSQGQASLALSGFSYVQVKPTIPLAKDGIPFTVVGYDIRIPQQQANPNWLGDTQLYIDAPSVGINGQYLGIRSLQDFPKEQFQRVEFAIPTWMQTALQGNYTDLKVTIAINGTLGNGTYYLDRFTLGPATGVCTPQNDNNPCTVDVCDTATGQTTHTPAPGASCADSNQCNGAELCDAAGTCQPSQPPSFDDANPCTVDACSPASGITHTPAAAGTSCSDSNACNGAETCNASGQCTAGTAPVVDDGNPCTTDSCNAATGVAHLAVAAGTSCSDGNACNGAETCGASGTCGAGTSPATDDANPCTADSCDPIQGVVHVAVAAGTACADGNVCNGAEACNGSGSCVAGTPPVVDDGNPCTADSCGPSGVVHAPVAAGTACGDGNACNGPEACNGAGVCVASAAPVVDDGNPCTVDSCDPVQGVVHAAVSAGTSCSDGNACNGAEACNGAGTCAPGQAPATDDGNPCTDDSCQPLSGVVHVAVAAGTACSDGNTCNGAEACDGAGACAAGVPPTVDDGNPCTADSCGASGVVHTPVAAGAACGDDNACNGAETCNGSGSCVASAAPVVDDGNPCTADSCDPSQGVIHAAVSAGTSCSDGNACNGAEACNGAGACGPGAAPAVDDGNPCTEDSCQPETGVVHVAVAAGASCADSNVCNGAETCDGAGSCAAGTALSVDDGNPCTADSCHPTQGVSHEAVAAGTTCSEATTCTSAGVCDANAACQPGAPVETDDGNSCTADYCDPVFGVKHDPRPAATPCNDGNVCNGAELCDGAGTCDAGAPADVNDGDPCTIDSCDATQGVVHVVAADGSTCSDDDACTQLDVCQAGACVGSEPVDCVAPDACHDAGTCNPLTGACSSPAKSDGTACDDGQLCTTGDACQAGSCVGGPPPVLEEQPCRVGQCDPLTGAVVYLPVPAGSDCNLDACTEGACTEQGECVAAGAVETDDGDPGTIDRCDPVEGPLHIRASAIDPTVATTVLSSTAWLYTGESPIQTGVAPGTIEARRAALLRGSVKTRSGDPIPGVVVKVHGHPELGETTTHANGTFDVVVNGGGFMQVTFTKPGYLDSSRLLEVGWNQTREVPEVVLIPSDPVVTQIDLEATTSEFQVARGSVVTDDSGTRQATLLFPPGVQATMRMPDGTTQPLSQMHVRATEFTVGDTGLAAMPASLPANTAYTYAFEVNADEAIAAGAPEIEFSEPLIFYTDNFLGFPAGTAVPLGSYDREAGAWMSHQNGIVIAVVGEVDGLATLDLTGDGVAEGAAPLAAAGIGTAERARIAELYDAGASLWRVRLPHFTQPWDCNWPFGFPNDAIEPKDGPFVNQPLPDSCEVQNASTLDCYNQDYRESVSVPGTPFSMNYASARAEARNAENLITIPVTPASVPESLVATEVRIVLAGQSHSTVFDDSPNRTTYFTWDQTDAYGRKVQGRQTAWVTVTYAYKGVYGSSRRFGSAGGAAALGDLRMQFVYLSRTWSVEVGRAADYSAAGGWTVDVHHNYQPGTRQILLGDGTVSDATVMPAVMQFVAGQWGISNRGEGGDARYAFVSNPKGLAVGPDGSVYFGDYFAVRRVNPQGIITTIAGTGTGSGASGDGIPASTAMVNPTDVAVAPDGTVYIAEVQTNRVRKVGVDGIITTIAGPGVFGNLGDGGPATAARLNSPTDLAIAADGSLYIAEFGRVRQVTPDGTISTAVGNGSQESGVSFPDDALATEASINPTALDFDSTGALLILQEGHSLSDRVYKLRPDGKLVRIAGCRWSNCPEGVDQPALQQKLAASDMVVGKDGAVYLAGDSHLPGTSNRDIQYIDPQGFLRVAAGQTSSGTYYEGAIAARSSFEPDELAVGPNGTIVFAELLRNRVTRIDSALPGIASAETVVASSDGTQAYVFATNGRHLRTVDARTLSTVYLFEYDVAGRLTGIRDAYGRLTQFERDGSGELSGIVAPYGQRTVLTKDEDGYLESLTTPAGGSYEFAYEPGGLLSSLTKPDGSVSRMTYDAVGRIVVDEDGATAAMSFVRAERPTGFTVERSTGMGRTTTYDVERQATGVELRTTSFPDGTSNVAVRSGDASATTTRADGTQTTTTKSADPRWGMRSPVISSTTRLPSGLERVMAATRTVALTDPTKPFTLASQTDTQTVNGRAFTTTYQSASRTFTNTSPQGRITRRVIDSFGRDARIEVDGLLPVTFLYDADGRLQSVTQGTRSTQFGYATSGAAKGSLQTVTSPLNTTLTYSRDALGRALSTSIGGATTGFTWDANDNLASLTPPGQPSHGLAHTPVNLLDAYAPPSLGAGSWSTDYVWDLDRNLTHEFRPGGANTENVYDAAGRLTHVIAPSGVVEFGYYPAGDTTPGAAPGHLATASGPYDVTLSYGYDGELPTRESWEGAINGAITWSYNQNFVPVSETVATNLTTKSTVFGYDNDLLLTCVSPTTCAPGSTDALNLTRDTRHGLVTALTQGALTEARAYSRFGEITGQAVTAGGAPVISFQYDSAQAPRDALGRIKKKSETFAGTTKDIGYAYDVLGRLTDVTVNGTLAEHYEYDLNGNRLLAQTSAGTRSAGYDAQDRLTSYGAYEYRYTRNGELQSRTDHDTGDVTEYTYDVFGSLTSVALPDDRLIEYVTDARGRRVAKKVDGVVTRKWLYRDQLAPVAELDGAGNLIAHYGYATRANVPDYTTRDGVLYRIVTDQLGSVRLIVNANNPSDILFRAEYSGFGVRTVLQGDPEVVPFGFAGGLYDADTGLVRFGAREYDPEVGRWTAKDPILFGGGQSNLYVYVGNDPVNFVDPEGELAWFLAGAFFLGADVSAASVAAYVAGAGGLFYAAANWDSLNPGNWFVRKADTRQVDQIARELGIARELVRNAIEKIKKAAGLRPNENVDILPDGTVRDPVSGDDIGHIEDEACGKR